MALNFPRLESITKALKSNQQTGKKFHATFVYHGSKLICIAHNDYSRLHPYHKYGEYVSGSKGDGYVSGLHSECSALIKMGFTDCSHLTFINVRVNNHGKPATSKPCKNCERLLSQVGYKALWYYDGEKYIKTK